MMEDRDYAQDLSIDSHNLDAELIVQPELFGHYTALEAEARLKYDNAKEELDVVKGETELAMRSSPEDYGLEKVTEATVAAALAKDDDVREALKAFNQCKYELNMIGGAVRSFEQRMKSLEYLVRLHGQEYFNSTPGEAVLSERVSEIRDTKRILAREKVLAAKEERRGGRTKRK
jgi:hypothetical protein